MKERNKSISRKNRTTNRGSKKLLSPALIALTGVSILSIVLLILGVTSALTSQDEAALLEQELVNAGYGWLVDYTLNESESMALPSVEVYEAGQNRAIARFDSIGSEGWHKIFLTNLSEDSSYSQDIFDLRVSGGSVEFDYVVDPDPWPNCPNSTTGNVTIQTATTWTTSYTCDNVTITNGSTLTFDNANAGNAVINLTANSLTIDAGASISASGKGYAGSSNQAGSGSGGGVAGSSGAGAGYGGIGGRGRSGMQTYNTGGTFYGSLTQPNDLGSAGGSGESGGGGGGGSGGGSIKLNITGTLTLNGPITSNGGNGGSSGSGGSGGGAGGSVWITAGTLAGNGTISANGGSGGSTSYYGGGGGSGGRIALYYNSTPYNGTVSATGGAAGSGGASYGAGTAGGAGTIYTKSTTQTNGDLIIDNNGVSGAETPLNATSYNFDNVTLRNSSFLNLTATNINFSTPSIIISNSATLRISNSTFLNVTNLSVNSGTLTLDVNKNTNLIPQITTLTVLSGAILTHTNHSSTHTYSLILNIENATIIGSINATGKGYAGGSIGAAGSGTGGGAAGQVGSGASGAGAGYGGSGGSGRDGSSHYSTGGTFYGSLTQPNDLGSGAGGEGSGGSSASRGGSGGGSIKLNITGTLTLNGSITSDGIRGYTGSTSAGPSGGSGGSIWITAGTLTGNGTISASGDSGGSTSYYGGGGGAGGRIALYYNSTSYNGTISATGGAAGSGGASYGAGTAGSGGSILNYLSTSGITCLGYDSRNTLCTNGTMTLYTSYSINNSLNITKKILGTWNNSFVLWNDSSTNSSAVAIYNITGLKPNRDYFIYDNGTQIANSPITTSSAGNLPIFNITLASEHYIEVNDYDLTPPRITFNRPTPSGIYNATLTFNVTLNEYGSAVFYTFNNGATNTTMTSADNLTWTAINSSMLQGNYTVKIYANDSADNWNTTASQSFTIDTTAPTIDYGNNADANNANITTRTNIFINISSTDSGGGGVSAITINLYNSSYQLINSSINTSNPATVNFTNLAFGVYYFNATVNDTAGNSNSTATRTVYVGNYTNCPSVTGVVNITTATTWTTSYTCDSVTVTNGSTLTFDNANAGNATINLTANSLTIDAGASINANSKGYSAGSGAGASASDLSGAGYGGNGGRGWDGGSKVGGSAYGSLTQPVDLGSGGRNSGGYIIGGAGGGAIKLNVSEILNITGSITANGGNGLTESGDGGGGGSGGSVWITAGTLAGNGTISANGGVGGDWSQDGGAGGGGRIAIYYTADSSTITKQSSGGATGYQSGKNGTQLIYGASSASGIVCSGADAVRSLCTNGNISVYTLYSINSTANSSLALNVNRTVINIWNSSSVSWNDTSTNSSNVGIYNVSGLTSGRAYEIKDNGTGISGSPMIANSGNLFFNVTLSSPHFISLSLDTTPPLVTINTPASGGVYGSSINFNVSLNEDGSSMSYSLDNGVTNISMLSTDNRNWNATNSSIGDGNYVFRVYVNDSSDNWNRTASASFNVDILAPAISFVSPTDSDGANLSRGYVLVNATASDLNLTNITIYLYNSTGLVNSTINNTISSNFVNISGLLDGLYWFNATAVDIYNGQNSTLTRGIRIDSTKPLIDYGNGVENNGENKSRNWIYVNVSGTEANEANITFRLFNSTGQVNESIYTNGQRVINWTSLNDGSYSYNVTIVDYASNANNTATRVITLDNAYPLVSYGERSESNGTYLNRNNIIVNASVSEANLRNVSVYLFNSSGLVNESVGYSSPFWINWTGLSDGRYWFNFSAFDSIGNKNNSETRSVVIDSILPNVVIAQPGNISYGISNLSLNYSASDVNRDSCWFNVNNGVNQSLVGCANISYNAEQGSATIRVYANDSAGNVNYSSVTFFVESVIPLIDYGTGTGDNGVNLSRNWIYVNVSVTEANEANITFRLFNNTGLVNLSVWTNGQRTINWTGLSDGSYSYNVTIVDYASNANNTATRAITLDNAYPLVSYGSGSEVNLANLSRSNIVVNVSASDNLTGLKNISVSLYNSTRAVNTSIGYASPIYLNFSNLSEEVYYVNASAFDYAGNRNDSETRTIRLDRTQPVINWKNKTNARRYGNVNLSVNASDALSGLGWGMALVSYPNGSLINWTMSLSGGVFNLTLINLSVVGDYDVNYSINDSAGNSVIAGDSFEVYLPLNVSGNVSDAAGAARNYTYKFYRPGTNVSLYNFTGSNYTLMSDEVHLRVYDLEIIAGNNLVKLSEFNLSANSIDVGVDNFTLSSIVDSYKPLTGIAVNTSFNGSATINLSYSGLFDASVSAVNESGISVHKCSSWSYTARSCTGSYVLHTNKSVDIANDRVVIYTNGFSSYILTENTCGNSICQAAYGESVTTCSADCGSGGSSSSGGSSGGGGGGSSSSATQTTLGGALQVSLAKIERELNVGENASEQLTISNTNRRNVEALMWVDDKLKGIMSFEKDIGIPALDSKRVNVYISGIKEGVYSGNLYIKSNNETQTISVRIIVKGKTDKLMDIKAVLDSAVVDPGEELKFKVSAFNLGQMRRYDILITYDIIYIYTNTSILHHEESAAIETSLSLDRNILIPSDAPLGKYFLAVKANYDNASAGTSASFRIGKTTNILPQFIKDYLPVFMSGIIIIFILFAGGYYFVYIRKKLFEKKMEEKKKSSIYPFPDFFALPKSKYAYIGMVADAGEKTYLDHTQLNRHTLIAGGTGSGKTVAGMDIVEELLKKGLPIVVFDPVGQWTGFAKKNSDSAMRSLYRKFKISGARAFKPIIIEINEKTMSLDIIPYLHKNGLTVLKLDGLTPLKADKFIEGCLNAIYRANLPEIGALKALVVLDEVHRLLPKYGGRRAYLKLEQAVREFRKWGVGLLMISQVLTDFKGAIRGNIGTEIQLHTKYEGDIKRVRERHGSALSKLISRLPVGIGMIESGGYNKGLPYFVEFRPLLHSPYKLNEKDIKSLTKEEKPILLEENVNLGKKLNISEKHKELKKHKKKR